MKIVLDIENERDWLALHPLLERLKISFTQLSDSKNSRTKSNGKKVHAALEENVAKPPKKNYDIDEIEALIKKAHEKNIFASIDDPLAWQKQIRDEWEQIGSL